MGVLYEQIKPQPSHFLNQTIMQDTTAKSGQLKNIKIYKRSPFERPEKKAKLAGILIPMSGS